MSSAVFFHNFNEINWKSLAIACIATATAASLSIISSQGADKYLGVLTDLGKEAESVGQYKLARQNFDLALLRARASGKQQELISTLINSARIDHEFEETKLAITLASEALELSKKVYGKYNIETANAMVALADVLEDSDESLALYKNAASIFDEKLNGDDLRRARVLLEMSYCYADKGSTGAAISAVKAAKTLYEQNQSRENQDYARTLIQYATLTDVSDEDKSNLLKQALTIQEKVLGDKHPSLSPTLNLNAAQEKSPEKKVALIRRALQIDEAAFGQSSMQAAGDLVALAEALESEGKAEEAKELRMRAALACKDKNEILASMSTEFLQSYAQLLRDLKFDSESKRIESIIKQKQAATPRTEELAQQAQEDSENDPEYWQRTEMIPIDGIQNFNSNYYDHIQLIYESAAVKLEAFKDGNIELSKTVAQCPTGIVNASAKNDEITLSWRDGDGPIWHKQIFRLDKQNVSLISSTEVDAYALQLEQQLDSVLKGEQDALDNGAIEVVPSTYINSNFIADA
ncbi:MAG: tetratricopeptide repeat protein, partial [Candidatus Obscuribacterales bacterium]|nr:tetratricopeptide repeat protein [Candidatus Obscuribacterales bacterium]